MLDICMWPSWTEFYFMAKSLPILICIGVLAVIGVVVLFLYLLDLWTKLVHKITTKGKDDDD